MITSRSRTARLRPVAGGREWLEAAAIAEGPVFRSIKKGGRVTVERLSNRSVAQIVKARAKAAGFSGNGDASDCRPSGRNSDQRQ